VNNAVGTLAMGHYYDEDTVAAVVIGAGTNASYIERNAAIAKSEGLLDRSDDITVIYCFVLSTLFVFFDLK
jgi:hexokinase